MPLELHPCTLADIDAIRLVDQEAFAGEFEKLMYPNGWTEDRIAWDREDKAQILSCQGRHGIWKHLNKVIDTALPAVDPYNKIISVASWSFVRHDRTEADVEGQYHDFEAAGRPPSENAGLFKASVREITYHRRDYWTTKRYMALDMLITLPAHQRRGAGSMQLRWGINMADAENLPGWVEASKEGRGLYERYGFKVVDQSSFNATEFGLPALEIMNMRRPAKHGPETKFQHFKNSIINLGGGPGVLSTFV